MAATFISAESLRRNFAEVKAGMRPKEAIEESNRCLYCYDAPCIKACPTGINIPSFIKKIASGNMKGSARTIMEANPVGASCSRVCPTEELCEGACVLNHSSKPIMIGDLQRYATDWAIRNEQVLFTAGRSNGNKIAVIGGGPAGLSAARELARFGFAVTIFEAKEQAGGLDTYGIVSFRLPQEISLWEVEQVKQLGVEIRTGVKVGVDIAVEEIRQQYDAVVLAIGMSKVPKLGIEGEGLRGVYDAIDFVESTKTSIRTDIAGKKVAVIGAGNTAIDAATCSVRLGAGEVTIVYRRTVEEMTAYDFEFDFAKQDGVVFKWLTAPKRVVGDTAGNVTAMECIAMRLEESEGRSRPVPVAGSEFFMDVDAVVLAIGQNRHIDLVEQLGLSHKRGIVAIDPVTFQTSDPQIFAAGDVIFGDGQGEAMVVSAAQQGKKAAYAIYRQLVKQQEETA
ncbi:NAD(P)-dependent oxidoreductase [Paenibacillus glycanilyticus]|uniref:NAD(P)-dependent oxidoreductase n=1 Tax=Paenibacillus glycanilyticus TaxID=126569 RepID=UPI00203BCCC1|nr:NAD(P)-dependent oxidoreductase [Paenibacillus glycanilyticus]MCM3631529.1 NAD(P)-dependent oxidoreductase [Paenibacillus glycanilyticus]